MRNKKGSGSYHVLYVSNLIDVIKVARTFELITLSKYILRPFNTNVEKSLIYSPSLLLCMYKSWSQTLFSMS